MHEPYFRKSSALDAVAWLLNGFVNVGQSVPRRRILRADDIAIEIMMNLTDAIAVKWYGGHQCDRCG